MSDTARMTRFVRFQSPHADARGRYVGVFGLVNAAAKSGQLTSEQEAFRRTNNDWFDAYYADPNTVDRTVYDPGVNPAAAGWFKADAVELIDRTERYLDLCRVLGICCERVESENPGKIIYEDEHQIVVVSDQYR
ncbi:hypothetical protein MU582_01770 [Nocardioidaceae bacterium SCSIO 66511]|nr:hypothetical protein MU582_01770 [Nocardioidaceae bacterium SCSIO 66511]